MKINSFELGANIFVIYVKFCLKFCIIKDEADYHDTSGKRAQLALFLIGNEIWRLREYNPDRLTSTMY